jgi:hypothetical protein
MSSLGDLDTYRSQGVSEEALKAVGSAAELQLVPDICRSLGALIN